MNYHIPLIFIKFIFDFPPLIAVSLIQVIYVYYYFFSAEYNCPMCNYSAKRSYQLKVHFRCHTKEKPYQCDYAGCKYETSYSQHLKVHRRTHTNQRPFKCAHCTFKCNYQNVLKDHERTHTGEKTFKCDFCQSLYFTRSNLMMHKRAHTNEKPYRCDNNDCKRSFKWMSSLKAHRCNRK